MPTKDIERCARLKPQREKSLLNRHPWIFSGALESLPEDCKNGEILPVLSSRGQFQALAYFHPAQSLTGRVLSFQDKPLEQVLREKLEEATLKRSSFDLSKTNAYRLINSEGDGIPGLVVDKYDNVLVLQATTAGIVGLVPTLIPMLAELLKPYSIYEKSHGSARKQEGLSESQGVLWGRQVDEVEILENGMKFIVSLKEGQKTGFFLDQREMRKLVYEHSRGMKVMNAFAYTGGFSVAALMGGAVLVDSIEISSKAVELLEKNCPAKNHRVFCEDVFDFIQRETLDYDLMIVDPPAFAKKRADVDCACRGYKRLLVQIFSKAKPGARLLFSSCSHYIDEKLLEMLIFQAALQTDRDVTILSKHHQALDHPISIFHPEGHYLKSFFLSL